MRSWLLTNADLIVAPSFEVMASLKPKSATNTVAALSN